MLLRKYMLNSVACWKSAGAMGVADAAAAKLWPVLSPVAYKSLRMLLRLGYWPNIRNPRSLNEKVAHRQLFAPHPLASLVADKWRVREYVAERGLAHILNEIYYVTDAPETIPFDNLPARFVVKANHASRWNIFVTDKTSMDRQAVILKCRVWLGLKYGQASRSYESHYDSIPPLILVERFLRDEKYGVPLDYKIDCFHGRAYFIGVKCSSANVPIYTRFDRSWNQLHHAKLRTVRTGVPFPRPEKLETLIDVAERLSAGIDYCRVDLYLVNDEELLFGEITMNPSGGANPILKKWDFRMGELW